tara:strand:- start:14118 stop:14465 length:348 start_codon:yes stop_codon:yes gene_type:complete
MVFTLVAARSLRSVSLSVSADQLDLSIQFIYDDTRADDELEVTSIVAADWPDPKPNVQGEPLRDGRRLDRRRDVVLHYQTLVGSAARCIAVPQIAVPPEGVLQSEEKGKWVTEKW